MGSVSGEFHHLSWQVLASLEIKVGFGSKVLAKLLLLKRNVLASASLTRRMTICGTHLISAIDSDYSHALEMSALPEESGESTSPWPSRIGPRGGPTHLDPSQYGSGMHV